MEANNVVRRLEMTEEDRRNTQPSKTVCVPRSRQIVVLRGDAALKQLGLVSEEKLNATREAAWDHFYSLIPSEYARVSSQVMAVRDGSKDDVGAYYTDEVAYIVVRGDEKTNSFVVAGAIHFDAELSASDVARITEVAKKKIRREGKRGLSDSVGVYRDVFGANGGSVALGRWREHGSCWTRWRSIGSGSRFFRSQGNFS